MAACAIFAVVFQFTPLREGRLCGASSVRAVIHFNSRPSARGDVQRRSSRKSSGNFNSRPSARGDGMGSPGVSPIPISIHAPPRGATAIPVPSLYRSIIFQFTPLREGRPGGLRVRLHRWNFNSRPSARGDACAQIPRRLRTISIHAPPRGATRHGGVQGAKSEYFNSRPSARGDGLAKVDHLVASQFQFTPLREGRRTCEGRPPCRVPISIHAPPRGATKHIKNFFAYYLISIHAPPRGATRC